MRLKGSRGIKPVQSQIQAPIKVNYFSHHQAELNVLRGGLSTQENSDSYVQLDDT